MKVSALHDQEKRSDQLTNRLREDLGTYRERKRLEVNSPLHRALKSILCAQVPTNTPQYIIS
jgi:hypothetical protein